MEVFHCCAKKDLFCPALHLNRIIRLTNISEGFFTKILRHFISTTDYLIVELVVYLYIYICIYYHIEGEQIIKLHP